MKRHWLIAGAAVLALTACRPTEQNVGSLHGRVVTASGVPVRGARVALDSASGRAVMTNVQGEFRITAGPGQHELYALHAQTQSAAAVEVSQAEGSTEVGDVILEDCGAPTPWGTTDPDGETGPTDPPPGEDEPDTPPPPPCDWEEPPPPPATVHIDSFEADYVDGFIDSYGAFLFGDSMESQAALDVYVQGDFSEGGTYSQHVVNDYSTWDVATHVGLFTYDSYGYYYGLKEGDIDLVVEDSNGDGNLDFHFTGTDLTLQYLGWDGYADPAYTATVGTATLDGEAWVWQEPEPPTEDVIIDPFVADWVDIMLLDDAPQPGPDGGTSGGGPGGPMLWIYAFDSSNNADLSLGVSLEDLTLPGSSDLTGWLAGGTTDGFASYYGDDSGNSWYYDLNHITVSVDAASISVGDTLTISLSDGQFDYTGSGGVVVGPTPDGEPTPDAGAGGATSSMPPEPEPELHLFIDNADLSGEVMDGYGDGPVPLEG